MLDVSNEISSLKKLIEPYCDEYGMAIDLVPIDWFYSTEDLRNYSFILPFETQLNRANFVLNAHNVWIGSILVSIIYIALIFGGQKFMSTRKPFELRLPLIIWNISMTIFSIVGFIRVQNELFRSLDRHGFLYSVCFASYGKDPIATFWISTFVRSKFIELLDTAFIVLRKKPLVFLHWYHHVTVLVFSWHSAKGLSAAGRWWAWMNYGVHSFMYSYYAARAIGYRVPKWFQMSVTAMQISQMVMGVVIGVTVWIAKGYWKVSCHQSWANLYFAGAIYFSYFILFCKLFYDAYMKPKHSSKTKMAIENNEEENNNKIKKKES